MDNAIRVFSGRTFSPADLETIKWARRTYPGLSRSELASTVCELLEWTTPAGQPKRIQCLKLFDLLEEEGITQFPPKRTGRYIGWRQLPQMQFDTKEIVGETRDYEPIVLEIARPGESMTRWRSYINQYHMIGDKNVFGSRLQYFVKSGDIELGCLQFSASAWALEERDKWIGWTKDDKKERLQLVVNNSRFLIFPWVHVRNLASKSLSLAAKRIREDWLTEYCYTPVLLETFVDTEHFKGTCYRAANWTYLGETKGSGRSRDRQNMKSKKSIYIYPLQGDFRECLKGLKPYKVVNPE